MKNLFGLIIYMSINIIMAPGNNSIAQSLFEVEGSILISESQTSTPNPGTIRWNDERKDFEGYNGLKWVTLTGNGGRWGSDNPFSYEHHILIAMDGLAGEEFGESVAASGEYIAVGAEEANLGNGKVYLYEDEDLIDIIEATNAHSFGEQLDMTRDWLVIGTDDELGFVYNIQDQKLIELKRVLGSSGLSQWLKIDNNLIVAHGLDSCLYTFQYNSGEWIETDQLCFSLVSAGFDISGILLSYNDFVQDKVRNFIRNNDQWVEIASLPEETGFSAGGPSIDGYSMAVPYYPISNGEGFIGYYEFDGEWQFRSKLYTSRGEPGITVLKNGTIGSIGCILGSDPEESLFNGQGKLTVFEIEGGQWVEKAILTSSDGRNGDIFGSDFDIGENRIIVGAQWADINPTYQSPSIQQGKAYIFYK